ncbi:exopolysaccharide transport family protein [Pedobacter deserti]|uniref:exopolysaccharide transport family protein n=1 Tax=Pedobacter deserti TaxID=2817382 RepID=UPI00210CEEA0|nr:lipopolysaccharide biosynthesis protein [Pedobacter sp. SYSU D00382]
MDEIKIFLKLLLRYKLVLIIVPAVTVIITFFLVRNMPDVYVADAQISTGIVDDTQNPVLAGLEVPKTFQVNQEFSNLVEMMRMSRILDLVSYRLIINDLTTSKPFRPRSQAIKETSTYNLTRAVGVYRDKYNRREGLNLWDKDQSGMYRILRSMGYDSESLRDKLRINRAGDSDFINIEFSSENAELSAFVVNTLSAEFIKYYAYLLDVNQQKAGTFLSTLLEEKRIMMNKRIDSLRNYKIKNRVLNLDEQSKQIYSQITTYNDRKQQLAEGIAAKSGALIEIDRKFSPSERGYLESTMVKLNQRLANTREELKALNDRYITNDFDPEYKESIDSANQVLNGQINESLDQFIYSPLIPKQELIQRKVNLEVELDLARYSVGMLERELGKLNSEFDKLVPFDASVQSMERDVEVSTQEYLDVLNKYNQNRLQSSFSIKLSQVQTAMPGLPEPSKKMLLVILGGVISLMFCVTILFLMYYFDKRVILTKHLKSVTSAPVLGEINHVDSRKIDLRGIWTETSMSEAEIKFRDQLRSLRSQIDKRLDGKILTVTSLGRGEGKSFMTLSLAFAWEMTKKKVLIIDGNFTNPYIGQTSNTKFYVEDFLNGTLALSELQSRSVTILGNRGGDPSLMEVASFKFIRERFDEVKSLFDLVIIETAPLDSTFHSKEWLMFADNVVAVFEYGSLLNEVKKENIEVLKENDRFLGWIFNKVNTLESL